MNERNIKKRIHTSKLNHAHDYSQNLTHINHSERKHHSKKIKDYNHHSHSNCETDRSELKYRKHSKKNKVSFSNSIIKENNLKNEKIGHRKKVRFSKVDIIDVDCWKKYNLELTVDENLEELLMATNDHKKKEKTIKCNCVII